MPKGMRGFQKGHGYLKKTSSKGVPKPQTSGDKHWNWKGGKQTKSYGYILVYSPDHPFRTTRNQVPEHRLVMEKTLGRYLKPDEIVHHINGIRDDNRPENLRLVLLGKNWHPHLCPRCSFEFLIK